MKPCYVHCTRQSVYSPFMPSTWPRPPNQWASWLPEHLNDSSSRHYNVEGRLDGRYTSGPIVADPGSASRATFQYMQFSPFLISVLSRSYFTSRTLDKDQKIEQLLFFLVVQVPQPGDIHEVRGERLYACYSQKLKKVPRAKSGASRFASFNSHDSTTIG